jgi:hypothetical protein
VLDIDRAIAYGSNCALRGGEYAKKKNNTID